jgi:syntaxin of plants SYP7
LASIPSILIGKISDYLLTSHGPGQIGEGLQQLKRNDQQLDQQLEQISKGLTRLKGIAVDQSNEIKLQGVMIDQIGENMDKATGHLNDVNLKLKETLQKAGGATNIIVKMILLILLLGVAAYLYKMFA